MSYSKTHVSACRNISEMIHRPTPHHSLSSFLLFTYLGVQYHTCFTKYAVHSSTDAGVKGSPMHDSFLPWTLSCETLVGPCQSTAPVVDAPPLLDSATPR